MLWCDTIMSLLAAQTSATNTGPTDHACAHLVPTSCRRHRELLVIERNVKSHLLDTGICRQLSQRGQSATMVSRRKHINISDVGATMVSRRAGGHNIYYNG